MARNPIRVDLKLDRIFCHDEGDGWGSAEPYLWTVFFKVDGATVQVTDALKLSGPPSIVTTPGSHGNLGVGDVDEGDSITIPSAIGEWQTIVEPIPGPPSLSSLFEDFAGVIGAVTVLMEEDNVSDDGANAGHNALNQAVRDAVQEIINTRSISSQDVTDEEINGFTSQIEDKVKAAIKGQQNFFENLWSWINPDDTIGTKVFIFNQDDLDSWTTLNFSQRWKNEGDWEIFGHLTSSVLCPANSLDRFFGSVRVGVSNSEAVSAEMPSGTGAPQGDLSMSPSGFDLDTLRRFRDGGYQEMPGLANWFALAERHTPRLIYAMCEDTGLRESLHSLLAWAPRLVANRDERLSDAQLDHAERALKALSAMENRRARIDSSRALDALRLVRGKSAAEAMRLLNSIQPARHPYTGGDPSLRIDRRAPAPGEGPADDAAADPGLGRQETCGKSDEAGESD